MTKSTEWLLRAGLALAILFYGWSFASQTVITILQQGQQIRLLTQQLQSCQNKQVAVKPEVKPSKEN